MAPSLIRKVRVILMLCIAAYSVQRTAYSTESAKEVRVAIIQDTSSLRLKINGFYELVNAKNNQILRRAKNINTTVLASVSGILLGDIKSNADRLFVKTDNPDAIIINGRRFRGKIQLIKKGNAHLLLVNHIDLEDYIKGILYHEVSHYWPMDALKAQAIVSRTYAVYQAQENKFKDYDVTADIYSQVYGGRASERYRTNKAVDETKGQILTYNFKVFPAFFHATCGGHTEDASLLWNINLQPLKGVFCGFCKESPHFNWHFVLSKEEIKDKLQETDYKVKNISDILVSGRDNSGRISGLKIITSEKEIKISAKDFRNIIGPNIIRSTNFTLSLSGNDVVFEGIGWGHGAGLCQWGAYFMAKEAMTFKQILKYYYPGSEISPVASLP